MKTYIKYFAAIILAVFAFTALAANPPAYQWAWSGSGTYTGTDAPMEVSYCVVSANMPPGTCPVITTLAYKSPTTNVVVWYTCTPPLMIKASNTNAVQAVSTNGYPGYALSGAPVIIRNTSTDKYTRSTVDATGAGHKSYMLTLDDTVATTAGDMLYFTTSTNLFWLPGVVSVSGTNVITGELISGQRDRPLLFELGGDGGTAGVAMGLAGSAKFVPQFNRSALTTP